MNQQTLKVFIADRQGEMHPDKRDLPKVGGNDIDQAMKAARKLLADRRYPPIRSINAAPNDTIIVYCQAPAQVAESPADMLARFRKPPKVRD